MTFFINFDNWYKNSELCEIIINCYSFSLKKGVYSNLTETLYKLLETFKKSSLATSMSIMKQVFLNQDIDIYGVSKVYFASRHNRYR
jgi:hypothetical protein